VLEESDVCQRLPYWMLPNRVGVDCARAAKGEGVRVEVALLYSVAAPLDDLLSRPVDLPSIKGGVGL
jgi:hypothetical protein